MLFLLTFRTEKAQSRREPAPTARGATARRPPAARRPPPAARPIVAAMAHTAPAIAQRRHLVTAIPGPNSTALAARRQASVAPGVSSVLPVYIARGEGAILVDVDGNSL